MKFLMNIVITLSAFLFCITIHAQEKATDKEIGFDEAYFRKVFEEDGFNSKEIDKKINETRAHFKDHFLNQSNLKKERSSKQIKVGAVGQKMIMPCTNMGFENGDFTGWCRRIGIFNFYNINTGYNVTYEDVEVCDPTAVIVEDIDPYDVSTDPCYNQNRFEIVQNTDSDPNGIDLTQIQGNFAVKLGNECVKKRLERIQQTITVSETNSTFNYRFALALEDTGVCGHISFQDEDGNGITCDDASPPESGTTIRQHSKPYFSVYLETNGQKIDCSEYLIFGDERIFDFTLSGGVLRKDWTDNSLNLLSFVNLGDEVTVVAEVADCAAGAHFGYAYFEGSCDTSSNDNVVISANPNACTNESISFTAIGGNDDYIWTFFDEDGSILDVRTDTNTNFTFLEAGYYRVTYGLPNTGTTAACYPSETLFVDIESCGQNDECEDCYSFSPSPGEKYWLAAWVKEDRVEQVLSYTIPYIELVFSDDNNQIIGTPTQLRTSGDIIEGWQRIIGEFTIPNETVYFNLNLMNLSENVPVYFDDIRVHPILGSMESYVYDPENYRVMAELDENNYTTYYEYDQEGGLIRVKKETTKGIMTIQETRSSSTKRQ